MHSSQAWWRMPLILARLYRETLSQKTKKKKKKKWIIARYFISKEVAF
jgi:hypothetical protein